MLPQTRRAENPAVKNEIHSEQSKLRPFISKGFLFLGVWRKKRIIHPFKSQILDRIVATKSLSTDTILAFCSSLHVILCLVQELHDCLASFSGI